MYALINLPGSMHFRYFGPAPKYACRQWLRETVARLLYSGQLESTLPRQILSNKEAEALRYRDGKRVCVPRIPNNDCHECGKPDWAPAHADGCSQA